MSAREHPPSSPHWWGWKHYGGHPTTRLLARYGLMLAPTREAPSDALRESQARKGAQAVREHAWRRKQDEDARELRERFAAEQHQRDTEARWRSMSPGRRQQMRNDVRRFGREVVVALLRRNDPAFDLPPDLKEEEEE